MRFYASKKPSFSLLVWLNSFLQILETLIIWHPQISLELFSRLLTHYPRFDFMREQRYRLIFVYIQLSTNALLDLFILCWPVLFSSLFTKWHVVRWPFCSFDKVLSDLYCMACNSRSWNLIRNKNQQVKWGANPPITSSKKRKDLRALPEGTVLAATRKAVSAIPTGLKMWNTMTLLFL